MDEHLKVLEGDTISFNGKFIDDNRMSIRAFADKHNNYSCREAAVLLDAEYHLNENACVNEDSELAVEVAAKRVQKAKYAKMPIFWHFFFRYIVKLGLLDGKEGLLGLFPGPLYREEAKVFEAKKCLEQKGYSLRTFAKKASQSLCNI